MNKTIIGGLLVTALSAAAPSAMAVEDGPWMVRARALFMENRNANSPDVGVSASDEVIPDFDITYFITKNVALELVLSVLNQHEVYLNDDKIGELKQIPPTLLIQYHMIPDGTVRPYVGIGVNYTNFSDVDLPDGIDVDRDSIGVAFQVGADFKLSDNWFANFDVKHVQIQTDVTVGGSKLTTLDIDPWLVGFGIGYRF